jgi:processive 1,2-diacylglycerol beta-glucosyltransferase
MFNKKILILSEPFGTGHTRAAEALAQGISLLTPSVHTQIFELSRELHPLTSMFMFRSYLKMITACPSLWKKIYQFKQNEPASNWSKFVIYQLFHRKMGNLLEQVKPNLVVCTHPFSSLSVSRLKGLGCPLRLCTVLTDFYAHGAWVQPEVDLYLVCSEEAKNQLIKMGITKNRIFVTGIPTKSDFWKKKNKQEVRRKLELKDLPTVMIMGGGLGLGGIWNISHVVKKWKETLQLIICTGYNETLKRSLSQDESFQHPHIHILGFMDNIAEWIDASDLIVTKPGGLTCFEVLLKGTPMLLYQPIPGHEEENCNFLVKRNLAIRIGNQNEVDVWIQKLLLYPREFELLQGNIREFQQKIDPMASARSIIKLLVT